MVGNAIATAVQTLNLTNEVFNPFKAQVKAVPWLRRLVVGLLPRRIGFDTRSAHVTCGGQSDTVTGFSPNVLGFRLSVAFHHCSILIFIGMLLLLERRARET